MTHPLPNNSVISHYRIVSKIGAGGMGEVYLAQDTKLDRRVALKILPAEVRGHGGRMERFVREAKSAAAFNHPNIAHIYEIGESDGTHFIAMEFIDGETLRDKIHRERTPLSKLLKYLIQVAQGLSKAHAAGIVHRDLKPENIMVTRDDYAKILDFGLAKLVEPDRGFAAHDSGSSEIATAVMSQPRNLSEQAGREAELSTPGMVMGTFGYMSPEQALGRIDEIDLRSDIFSFGCILFEAITGQRPFAGKDVLDSLHKTVHAPTPQLKDANPLAPAEMQRVVRRCLAKEPDKRYQSIKEVALELDDLERELKDFKELGHPAQSAVATSVSPSAMTRGDDGISIAVLPFKVRETETDVAVLAEGLSEEISNGLSRFRYLSVVTGSTVSGLQTDAAGARFRDAKFGARYVLEGSIRKGGSIVRVSVQLVDTETGAQLWSENYNRDLLNETLFAVQDDVAGRIVATVADSYGVLVHSMRTAMKQKDDVDLTPVEWQFQYFAYREQITPSSHAELKNRLNRVAERNVGQSDMWAALAQVYVDEYAFGFQDDATSLDRALAAGRRAVELDRANQFALVALAQVHFFRRDLAAFGPAAERGMALNPLNTDALGILGLEIVHTAQFERGTAIVRRAMELNPNHPGWMHFAPLWNHFHKREYEQALECANRVDVPGLFWPYLVMASACGHLGRHSEAEAAVKDLLALDPDFAAHARSNVESWHFASGLLEPILDGLRKAGLEIPSEESRFTSSSRLHTSSETRADEGFWVAVLPFKSSGATKDIESLAEGLSEDIVTGLSRFSYLHVIARGSTLRYANQTTDLRTVAKEIGARYVIEGTLRQAGTKIRVAVQLVDSATGSTLWAENYERELSSENFFELQDDLVPRIVSTIADWYGVLPHSMSENVRLKAHEQLSHYEALLRSFGYFENITPQEHELVRSSLERAVAQEPGNADLWAMLAMLFGEEHRFGFNVKPDSLGRSLQAARKAVAIAHANHFAWLALAQALFFRKEFDSFLDAAERAIALNPMDGSAIEYLGHLIAFSGNWERGCALAERARQLNPNHPSWYWSVFFLDAYRRGDYRNARPFLMKGNPQKNYLMSALLAAVNGQLGESEAAATHLQEVLSMVPDFPLTAEREFAKWYPPELVDHLMDGLRKAGLDTTADLPSFPSAPPVSVAPRVDEGFWLAVLPFKVSGSDTGVAMLAEGLGEEIVTGLSRFSYLRVVSHSSTLRYAGETSDLRDIGKTLGARYLLQGSLRISGTTLRVSVQLVDTTKGAHLWAETYDRQFSAEEIFALQDDLVPRIVSTVADINGVLPRSMSEVVCNRPPDELSPYEAVLRSFRYYDRVSPNELASALACLDLALEKAPTNSDVFAMTALLCVQDYAQGFNLQPDSLTRGTAAAQRAVETGPANHLAHFALAQARFFQKELESFRNAAERAVALNPMDGNLLAFVGELLTYIGDSERGLALAGRAKQINPNHPGWFWYADYFDAYRKGEYRRALNLILKANLPGHWGMHAGIAAAAAQLGEHEAAARAVQDLLKLIPDFGTTAHNELRKWFDPELCASFIEGLRKAGLEIISAGETLSVSSETRADEGFWIAVLPFKFTGDDQKLAIVAEGLTEEIVTGLSRFSYLRVIARSSTLPSVDNESDMRAIGRELGARYVMEGSVRQSGSQVRVVVQLIDTSNSAHLWAETYERSFDLDHIFAVQDDLVPQIVSSVADPHGVLPYTISEVLRSKKIDELTPYEAVMRSFSYGYRFSSEEHAAITTALQRAVHEAPEYPDAWAMLALVYAEEYASGFNLQPHTLDRALRAAQRAVEVGASNAIAHNALARTRFFRKEFQAFRIAAERAIELNPLNGPTVASMGGMLAYAGEWEKGCALVERAVRFHKRHPGWYWFPLFYKSYRAGDYADSVSIALKINLPLYFHTHAVAAAAYGQLGNQSEAENALKELIALKPDFASTAREDLGKWLDPELLEHMVAGLSKAGLSIAEQESRTSESAAEQSTTRTSFAGLPSIAVLPFVNISDERENEYFCEGLAEELLNALSKIDALRVAARTSAFSFKGKQTDIREIGARLKVSTVLEGSVRKSGSRVRIGVQLVNVADGYHLWSEKYDRELKDIFDIQDEISVAIVEALKVKLLGSVKQVIKRYTDNTDAYQLYLKGRFFVNQRTSESLRKAIEHFNQAISIDPNYALGYAGLADAYMVLGVPDAVTEALAPHEALPKARAAAMKALSIDDSVGEVYAVLAHIKWKGRDWAGAESDYRRSIELNPHNPIAHFYYAVCLAGLGREEEAVTQIRRAQELDPLALPVNASLVYVLYLCHRYDEAIEAGLKTLELDATFPLTHLRLGLAYVQKQMYREGINELEQAANNSNRAPQSLVSLGHAYAVSGQSVAAQKVLDELQALSRERYVSSFGIAIIYAGMGDGEQALAWLEKAYEDQNTELTFLKADPRLDPLRVDPRFQDLLNRVGFPD